MPSEQQVEKEIQEKGLNAPRLCPEDIDAVIVLETFTVLPSGKAMVCELILRNGFSVRGESACVSKANFNEEIGRKISREDARNKVWMLEGYLLQERVQERVCYAGEKESIAKICHEVNRAYCRALGDMSQVAWDDAPDWQKQSALIGVELHLSDPDAGPQRSHESWMSEKISNGWVYGPEKDETHKEHPCLVPFSSLPKDQQAKDYIFKAVVHAVGEFLRNSKEKQ